MTLILVMGKGPFYPLSNQHLVDASLVRGRDTAIISHSGL